MKERNYWSNPIDNDYSLRILQTLREHSLIGAFGIPMLLVGGFSRVVTERIDTEEIISSYVKEEYHGHISSMNRTNGVRRDRQAYEIKAYVSRNPIMLYVETNKRGTKVLNSRLKK